MEAVCSAAVGGGSCDCGPWAEPGFHHWRLGSVRALPRPIVAIGHPGLWEPKPSLVTEVTTMFATATLNNTT